MAVPVLTLIFMKANIEEEHQIRKGPIMSNSKSNSEQNKLFEQSEAQRNPRLARPEDFKVTPALPLAGQRGETKTELFRLLEESKRGNSSHLTGQGAQDSPNVDHAGKPHTP
jgi:hypothetical protein